MAAAKMEDGEKRFGNMEHRENWFLKRTSFKFQGSSSIVQFQFQVPSNRLSFAAFSRFPILLLKPNIGYNVSVGGLVEIIDKNMFQTCSNLSKFWQLNPKLREMPQYSSDQGKLFVVSLI